MSDSWAVASVTPVAADPWGVVSTAPAGVSAAKQKAMADARARLKVSPAGLMAFGQGTAAGFGDEMDAALAAGITGANNFARRMTGQSSVGYGMGDAYDAVLATDRAKLDAYAQEHPVQNAGYQVAGAVLSPAGKVGGSYVANGATAAARVGRAMQVGGAMGAVAGAGNARGGMVDRLKGGATGGAVGAMTGGVLQGGLEGAAAAGRAINAASGHRFISPAASAAGRLRDALRADGVDPATISKAMAEYADVGATSPTLADVAGDNTRSLLRFAGSRPGEARNLMTAYRDETVHGLPDAAVNRARDLTPAETRPATEVAADLTDARRMAADADYKQAYQTPVSVTSETRRALADEPGRAALLEARKAAVARMDDAQVAELDSLLGAAGDPPTQVSADTLDRTRIALREQATAAMKNDQGAYASGLRARQGMIDETLDKVPELAPARANYRSNSRAIEALQDVGPKLLKAAPDEFSAQIGALDERGLSAARVGARQALTDALGQRANANGALDQIAFAPNTRRNLVALFGEDEASKFISSARLNVQRARTANYLAPNTGSQTFSRDQDAKGFMSMLSAFSHPVQALLEKVANGLTLTDSEAAELVRAGISDPKQAIAGLQRPTMTGRIGSAAARIPQGGAVGAVQMVSGARANP